GWETNANAMKTLELGNSIFTNVALTDDGDVWWEGMTTAPPAHLTDWLGRSWTPESSEPSSHPNSRFCTPTEQCPSIAPEWDDPAGVPLSAIIFGGRRASTVPLVIESHNWQHGVFFGATLSSETTAAAEGEVGRVRRDPFAMLPFFGYHIGDYLNHWLSLGKKADATKLPKIYYVNWFRKSDQGKFLWPGFGENSRVLKWIVQRLENEVAAVETPIGNAPRIEDLDVAELAITNSDLAAALAVNSNEWKQEAGLIADWFNNIGEKLPNEMREELTELNQRL
ncbi:MAG: phosphoenolpyruvate carboxykinase domain-containing protein, partial [Candidatus Nanopelagicales bacterium]